MNITNIESNNEIIQNNEINENNNIKKKRKPYKKKEYTSEQLIERENKLKEKKALYALKYYRKKVDSDQVYKKLLNDRSKRNTNIRKGNDPDKPPSIGRPRKYI